MMASTNQAAAVIGVCAKKRERADSGEIEPGYWLPSWRSAQPFLARPARKLRRIV
jgi:hypothetical protein